MLRVGTAPPSPSTRRRMAARAASLMVLTISGFMPAGANRLNQALEGMSGKPCSVNVGTSGGFVALAIKRQV